MSVDVVPSDRIQRIGIAMIRIVDRRFPGDKRGYRRALSTQHHVINLSLPRRKVSIHRHGPRNVGGIHAVLACSVHNHNVAVSQRSRVL